LHDLAYLDAYPHANLANDRYRGINVFYLNVP
jgi:hypothetical protein